MSRAPWLCLCLLATIVGGVQAAGTIGVVVHDGASNPFGRYLLEILKTEGFGTLETLPLESLTLEQLQRCDAVVVSETPLTEAQASLLRSYVANGGGLVALRPNPKLDDLLGIVRAEGTTVEGYVKIDGTTAVGAGLETTTSLKMHGAADHFRPAAGATAPVSLHDVQDADTGFAAVIQAAHGQGKTAAFAYDLAQGIVLLRQGNPAWAGQEHDGVSGVRSGDLFYDAATKTSWNDASRSGILQADEQMRLLSHVLESLTAAKTPMPRFWYFPDAKKSVLVLTGDQDDSSVADQDAQFEAVKAAGGSASAYLLDHEVAPVEVAQRWLADGHEPAIHFDDTAEREHPTWAGMNRAYDEGIAKFQSRYPGVPLPQSVRNHHLVWCGTDAEGRQEFAAQAEIEQAHGLGLDLNNYFFKPNFQGTGGHAIPSGLPMRFAKSTGQTIDLLGADSPVTDEGYWEKAAEKYAELLDASLHGGRYAWIVGNFHQVYWNKNRPQVLAMLDMAEAANIPVWSGAKVNSFVRRRDAASFTNLQWKAPTLAFEVEAPGDGPGSLTVMLPQKFGPHTLKTIRVGNAEAAFSVETIAGADYALLCVAPGQQSVRATYAAAQGDR